MSEEKRKLLREIADCNERLLEIQSTQDNPEMKRILGLITNIVASFGMILSLEQKHE